MTSVTDPSGSSNRDDLDTYDMSGKKPSGQFLVIDDIQHGRHQIEEDRIHNPIGIPVSFHFFNSDSVLLTPGVS